MAIPRLAQIHSISMHVHSCSLNSLPSIALSDIIDTAIPPKDKLKTRPPNKQDFPCDKFNNIFHTKWAGFVLHFMRDCTAPPMQLEIKERLLKKLISLNDTTKQHKFLVQGKNH